MKFDKFHLIKTMSFQFVRLLAIIIDITWCWFEKRKCTDFVQRMQAMRKSKKTKFIYTQTSSHTHAHLCCCNYEYMCVRAWTLAQSISVFVHTRHSKLSVFVFCEWKHSELHAQHNTHEHEERERAALSVKSSDSCAVAPEILYSVSIPA